MTQAAVKMPEDKRVNQMEREDEIGIRREISYERGRCMNMSYLSAPAVSNPSVLMTYRHMIRSPAASMSSLLEE